MTNVTAMRSTLFYKQSKQLGTVKQSKLLSTTVSNICDDQGYFNDVNTHLQAI